MAFRLSETARGCLRQIIPPKVIAHDGTGGVSAADRDLSSQEVSQPIMKAKE